VYDVIFRVYADGDSTSHLDGNDETQPDPADKRGDLPNSANWVKIPGYDNADAATVAKIPSGYNDTIWQKASLTLPGGAGEPLIPWNIMLNSQEEIFSLISTRGFNSSNPTSPTATPKNTIRVWLEVFVFNGEGSPIRSSIYPNDGKGTAGANAAGIGLESLYGTSTPLNPKPYVKVFYIKTEAPRITNANVGSFTGATATNGIWNPDPPGYRGAGQEIRRGRFGVRAVVDPYSTTSAVGEIAYRIKLDGGGYGTWNTVLTAVKNTSGVVTGWTPDPFPSNNINFPGVKVSRIGTGINGARFNFEYDVNSLATANTADFAAINSGAWANSGGTFTIQIRMRDSSVPPNEAETVIQVAVDNFTPVADPNYNTNPKVAGSSVDFVGRVFDYATASTATPAPSNDVMNSEFTPRKASRVYAWFKKTVNGEERYVNMNTGATLQSITGANLPGTRTMSALDGRKATVKYFVDNTDKEIINHDTVTSVTLTDRGEPSRVITYPNMATGELAHTAAWIREISESTAGPGTNMLWSPVNSAVYDVRWSFKLDSTILPDGDITLCYLVVDNAMVTNANGTVPGNASYYEQKISIRNRYPQIERITLYTDNNGQGAAYTADAVQEYVVNDYRSKMFANYTDPADNQTKPNLPSGVNYSNADTTGYLNSGFISKNKYIGFKVETLRGNRPLNFKLQYVTRTKISVDAMLAGLSTPPTDINLYTIAWHGDYSSANWKALGVTAETPTLGVHFVPNRGGADIKPSSTAMVWKYTVVGTTAKGPFTPQPTASGPQSEDPAVNPVVLGPDAGSPGGVDFRFLGDTDFASITDKDGSHPDLDDQKHIDDNPTATDNKGTAFFLIRVWDSVGKPVPGTMDETWISEQLHDAVVVGMNIYLTDTTPPTARLYDLNPYTEMAVTGNNIGDLYPGGATAPDRNSNQYKTIYNAANPTAVGSNIVRGGLFNAKTERDLMRSGYIDPRNNTTALAPVNTPGIPAVVDFPLRVPGDSNLLTLPSPWSASRDKVSGRVILRGLAQDDQLIDEIRIKIGGDPEKPILKLEGGKMTVQGNNIAFAAETLHWKTGHTVEWAYVWDTEKEPASLNGGPSGTPVTVQVSVKDAKSSPGTSASVTLATEDTLADGKTFHNTIPVDVVPYITGFERKLPEFSTKRSLQGWYSFYQGEGNIALVGYNFGRAKSDVTVSITSSSGSMNMADLDYNPSLTTGIENTRGRFYFTMPKTAYSGRLNVTVGSTEAYNRFSSNTNKSWNSESNGYTPGSDLWINKPFAHIWRTTTNDASVPRTYIGQDNLANNTSAGLEHPGMALEYSGTAGRLHATWAVYGNAVPYYGNNNGSANAIVGGTPNEPALTPDISMFNGTGEPNIAYTSQDDGTPSLRVKSVVINNQDGGADMQTSSNSSTQRWKNVRISKAAANGSGSNNVGKIFVTANDAQNKSLWFGIRNGTNNNTLWIDGGNATGGVGGLGAVANAGEFSAVDYDNLGAIVAYYDQTNDTVRIAFGNDTPTQANNWTRRNLLPPGHALLRGSGKYISIKVDKSNGIHLSFYNSVYNTVVYYYAQNRGLINVATPPTPGTAADSTVKCHTVDSVLTSDGNGGGGSGGGTWTDVSVDNNGNPWIVYGDSSRTGNYDGVRVAYRSAAANTGVQFTGTLRCPVTTTVITGWEALTMPANYTVKNDRLNIEVWPPTVRGGSLGTAPGWDAAIGYPSDLFRVGYFYYPTNKP